MNLSLAMVVTFVDGICFVEAPWLTEPVEAPSWEEAYWKAVMARSRTR